MATYSSDAYSKNAPLPALGHAGELKCVTFTVACAAAPTTADTINFGYLPANAVLKQALLKATDMDTDGSPTIAIDIGDAADQDRIMQAQTIARTGGVSSAAIDKAGQNYRYGDKTLITGKVTTNATAGAAGSLYLTLFYTIEP